MDAHQLSISCLASLTINITTQGADIDDVAKIGCQRVAVNEDRDSLNLRSHGVSNSLSDRDVFCTCMGFSEILRKSNFAAT